jgi:hypothetical protein
MPDTTAAIQHSTDGVKMITSLSRWWDPPIQTSRACRIGAGESGSGKAMRHRQQLPTGNPIHDYIFEIQWQKNGAAHKALPRIPFQPKLALIQSLWCSGSKPRSTAPAARRDKNRRGPDPGASHSWRVPPSQQAPWSRARRDSAKPKGCEPNRLSRRCPFKGPFMNHGP